jgi:hypothetical protein
MPLGADVTVLWGETPIAVTRVRRGDAIAIGDDGTIQRPAPPRGAASVLVVRATARGVTVSRPGDGRGRADATLELALGARAHVAISAAPSSVYRHPVAFAAESLSAHVMATEDDPGHARAAVLQRRPSVAVAAVAALHAIVLATSAAAMPPLVPEDDVEIFRSFGMFSPPAEVFNGLPPRTAEDAHHDESDDGGDAQLCGHTEGPVVGRSFAVLGPADNPDPHLSNRRGDSGWGFLLGVSPEPASGDPIGPIAPWGRDNALGLDDYSALGTLPGPVSRGMLACFGEPKTPWSCADQLPIPPSIARVGLVGIGDEPVPELHDGRWRRPARVTTGAIQVAGNVPRTAVVATVQGVAERARGCYQRALADHALSSGALEVLLRVRGDRVSVTMQALGGAVDVAALECCVERAHDFAQYDLPIGTRVNARYTIGFGSWEHR